MRTVVMAAALAFGLVLALVLLNELTRKDRPEDYAELCAMLFEPTFAVKPPQLQPSDAEAEIVLRRQQADLPRLSRRCRNLAPIAQEYSALMTRAKQLSKIAPNLPNLLFGTGEAALGLYAGQRDMVGEGALTALKEAAKAVEAYPQCKDLWLQKHVAALELSNLATQFSAQPTAGFPLDFCFRERMPGFFGFEKIEAIILRNSLGHELRNCVIRIRPYDSGGRSYLRVHFVKSWPANQELAVGWSSTEPEVPKFDPLAGFELQVLSADLTTTRISVQQPPNGWTQF